ncbi:MAG TPA: hypothetical protein VE871_12295 [Longimicrobium sp.]|nr:hypothetical protein [Longimicrobium sp.]
MPMIGGEMAAETALASRHVLAAGEDYDLGWVTDWLYGDAALPPAPLPQRTPVPLHRHLAPVYAEPPVFAEAHAPRATPARRRARGGRVRQLALL